ncbi:DUF2066 domain-containing protein [Aerolutibacter ruishenii]|uniref:DUF2066 domain-containing protein n=1 Tax=Aerolutibacter ruishenii TaxID=686800 RepID=A0A562LPI8_9GAMM|nr:DUF2066 domain-containing protein [Lysobacter ruishenii]TWI09478.1 hypothetical protein IP93_02095 [Lysobacter ruishenii]
MLRAIRLFWAIALLAMAFGAAAQRVEGDRARAEGPYAAEVRVNGQGEPERNNAFVRALVQVLARLSGDNAVASRPGMRQELASARDLVESYDYRQDEGVSARGAPTFGTVLVVRFDPEAVDELAAIVGLPIWPMPRPKPVLWLAIDDGSGPRLAGLPQANATRPALDRAKDRGFALGLPAATAAEQAVVGAIWRGDTAAVARASARYSPPMQLVGKLYRVKEGWQADWIFVDGGKVLSRWTEKHADARRVMAAGADGAANALVRRYAKRGTGKGMGPAGTYQVTFNGIGSADAYIRLVGYLEKLTVVGRITPVRAVPGSVAFDLELSTGLPGLRRAVARDDVLLAEEGDEAAYRVR